MDILFVVDTSSSMNPEIAKVRQSLSALLNRLLEADVRFAFTFLNETRNLYRKTYSLAHERFGQLISADDGTRYNALNLLNDRAGAGEANIFPGNGVYRKRVADINVAKERLTNVTLVQQATSENGLCAAHLGYQTVSQGLDNINREAMSGFRADADIFSVIIISDEDAQSLNSCRTNIAIRNQPETSTCECITPRVGTPARCLATQRVTETYSCPTDGDPGRVCTREKDRCVQWQPASPDYVPRRVVEYRQCPAENPTPQTTCREITQPSEVGFANLGGRSSDVFQALESINDFRAAFTPKRPIQIHFVGYTGEGGCLPNGAGQSVGENYIVAAEATSGQVACIRDDFNTVFSGLGESIQETVHSIELEGPADKIDEVFVNGERLTSVQWSINGSYLRLVPGSVQIGDTITISYSVP